jgi:hypothetical protein
MLRDPFMFGHFVQAEDAGTRFLLVSGKASKRWLHGTHDRDEPTGSTRGKGPTAKRHLHQTSLTRPADSSMQTVT